MWASEASQKIFNFLLKRRLENDKYFFTGPGRNYFAGPVREGSGPVRSGPSCTSVSKYLLVISSHVMHNSLEFAK